MTTADPLDRPFSYPDYGSIDEGLAVVRLATLAAISEQEAYVRVAAKAARWQLSLEDTANRLFAAEHAQLAPEW